MELVDQRQRQEIPERVLGSADVVAWELLNGHCISTVVIHVKSAVDSLHVLPARYSAACGALVELATEAVFFLWSRGTCRCLACSGPCNTVLGHLLAVGRSVCIV